MGLGPFATGHLRARCTSAFIQPLCFLALSGASIISSQRETCESTYTARRASTSPRVRRRSSWGWRRGTASSSRRRSASACTSATTSTSRPCSRQTKRKDFGALQDSVALYSKMGVPGLRKLYPPCNILSSSFSSLSIASKSVRSSPPPHPQLILGPSLSGHQKWL